MDDQLEMLKEIEQLKKMEVQMKAQRKGDKVGAHIMKNLMQAFIRWRSYTKEQHERKRAG